MLTFHLLAKTNSFAMQVEDAYELIVFLLLHIFRLVICLVLFIAHQRPLSASVTSSNRLFPHQFSSSTQLVLTSSTIVEQECRFPTLMYLMKYKC